MRNNYIENEIFDAILKTLPNLFQAPIQYEIGPAEQRLTRGPILDKTLKISVLNKEMLFAVEIKRNVTRALIGQLLVLKDRITYPLLLVTDYVTDYVADILRQNGIEFIDIAGNAFIRQPPVYIFIKGNKTPDAFRRIPQQQAFRATGLKAVFAFLCNPDLVNKPYREIAATAGVALGNIGWIIKDLKNLGYVTDMGKVGYKLIKKEELMNRWIAEYREKLRPKLMLGRFTGDADWWKGTDLNCEYAQWGGEAAAAKLTGYLKPQNLTIYAEQTHLNDLLIENRLKKDINGDTEVLERFWKPVERDRGRGTVHPFLVYADLMATGDQRNVETAKMIFEKYVAQYIRED